MCCAIFADVPAVLSGYPRISNGRDTLLVSLAKPSQKTGMLLKTVAHALMLRAHAYSYSNPTSSSHLVANGLFHLHRPKMPAVGHSPGQYIPQRISAIRRSVIGRSTVHGNIKGSKAYMRVGVEDVGIFNIH